MALLEQEHEWAPSTRAAGTCVVGIIQLTFLHTSASIFTIPILGNELLNRVYNAFALQSTRTHALWFDLPHLARCM